MHRGASARSGQRCVMIDAVWLLYKDTDGHKGPHPAVDKRWCDVYMFVGYSLVACLLRGRHKARPLQPLQFLYASVNDFNRLANVDCGRHKARPLQPLQFLYASVNDYNRLANADCGRHKARPLQPLQFLYTSVNDYNRLANADCGRHKARPMLGCASGRWGKGLS